jgi:hypothetical protein
MEQGAARRDRGPERYGNPRYSGLQEVNWEAIRHAVELIEAKEAVQIKNECWTVYRTESCIRIDVFLKERT